MFKITLNNVKKKILFIHNIQTAGKYFHKSCLGIGLTVIQPPQKYLACYNNFLHQGTYSKRLFHCYFSLKYTRLHRPESEIPESEPNKLQDGDNSNEEFKVKELKALLPKKNVLLPPSESDEIDFVAPPLKPTFNIAAYADKSETLKQFIYLGVEIAKWEKYQDICFHILRMNFEEDIKPYIFFVNNLGIPVDQLGKWFSVNPFVFKESLENLQIRINYLKSKKFSDEDIAFIMSRVPKWINCSVSSIDKELGVLQRKFDLTNAEVRQVTISDPKLILHITAKAFFLERQVKCIEDQMGFNMKEQKQLLLEAPRLYRTTKDHLVDRFNVIHNEMGLSHETILRSTPLLKTRSKKLSERNGFLMFIGKNQYDPTKPNYVSALDLAVGTDAEFCRKMSSSIDVFNDFLKTM